MPGPGNKHLPYSEKTINPQILKQTKDEMLEHIEEDVELINVTLESPEATFAPELLNQNMGNFEATTKKLRERIENPTLMGRYERAHKLYYEKIIYGDFFKHHLAEKYPSENPKKPGELIPASLNFDEKHRFHRINTAMVQPDKSYEENYDAFKNSDPAKAMSTLVDEIMNSDISDLYTTDMDRFLDFVERNKITLFTVIGELDTLIEQDKIFLDKPTKVNGVDERSLEHGVDTNSVIMQDFAQSEEHPDGLTKEQINYLLEHRDMFCLMCAAADRIYDLATPFPLLAPDHPLARGVLALGADFEKADNDKSDIDYPNSVFSEAARKTKFYKNVPCQSVVGFYDSYSYQGAPEERKMKKALEEHPEIAANGWLNADFSGFTTDEHGEKIHLTKQTAIFKYVENPDSVKFELNDFGERKKSDREKNRNLARDVEKSLGEMEKDLEEIYGSKRNAPQEFNDLVTNIREFEKIAAEESEKFSPNLPLLSRNFKKIQEQANAYVTKEADLQGAQPDNLRKLRMDFANKIMSLHEPLYKDNKIKEFEDKLRNEQKELRNILNDMGADNPKIPNPRIEMINRLSRMLAIEDIMTDLKLDIDEMEFDDVDEAVSDENVNDMAETVKEMPTFARIVDEINRVDDADLKDMMEEFASSKDGQMFAKGGILDVYNTVFAKRTVDVQQGAKGTFADNDDFKALREKQDLKYTSAINRLNQYVQSNELPDMEEKIAREVALIVGLHLTDNKLKDAANASFDDKTFAGVKNLVDDTDYTKVQDELMAEPAFRELVSTLGKGPFTADDMNKLSDRCLDVVAADRVRRADEKVAKEQAEKERIEKGYENLIKEIEAQLSDAFNKKEASGYDLRELCSKYVLIDGKPLLNFYSEKVSNEEVIKKSSPMILKALVNNQDVSWAKPEERTNAFKVANMEKFPVPAGLKEALENEASKAYIDKNLETVMPVGDGIADKDLLEDTIHTTATTLEKLTSMEVAPFFKSDLLRDVMKEPENAGIQNGNEILRKLKDNGKELQSEDSEKAIHFLFDRNSFESHAVAMLINEGHTPEEIFDPGEDGIELRAQAGKRIYKLAKEKNVDELLRINTEGALNIRREMENLIKKIDYSDESSFFNRDNLILTKLAFYDFDLQQERTRYPKKKLDILASLEGRKIITDEDRAEYQAKYLKFEEGVFPYAEFYEMMKTKQKGYDYLLGIEKSGDRHDLTYTAGVFRGLMAKSLITEAIRNGEPIKEKLNKKITDRLTFADGWLEQSSDELGKELLEEVRKEKSYEGRVEFIKKVEDGTFAKDLEVGFNYNENGNVEPVIFSNPDKLSSKFTHHPKDREFFTKKFTIPTNKDVTVQEAEKNAIDTTIKSALEKQFNMAATGNIGRQLPDRLYVLGQNNELKEFDPIDFEDPDDMEELRQYLLQGRLFAVKLDEATPVQLGVSKDANNNWICSATDCLDNEPKPVEYKWNHKLGALFGIQRFLDRKAAYNEYTAKLAIKDTIVEKKISRREAASFESVVESIDNDEFNVSLEKRGKIAELSAKNAAELEKYPKATADVIKRGNEAIETLQMAELDNKYIEPERKLQLVKDVVKSNLVKVFSASPVEKALIDPKTGDEAFKQIFEAIYPDQEKFKYMLPKYLVDAANNVKNDIANYQKKYEEQLEKANQKSMDEPKLNNPQVDNLQPVGNV